MLSEKFAKNSRRCNFKQLEGPTPKKITEMLLFISAEPNQVAKIVWLDLHTNCQLALTAQLPVDECEPEWALLKASGEKIWHYKSSDSVLVLILLRQVLERSRSNNSGFVSPLPHTSQPQRT